MMETTAVTTVHDRRKFVGGSDIAAILDLSPWRTAGELYADKITPPVDKRSRVKTRGQKWESVVAEMLVAELVDRGHKVEIVSTNRRYIDEVIPFFAVEIDFEIRLDDEEDITNVEIKTVHPFKAHEWGESGSDDLPIWYTAQAMWGLGVAPGKRKRCIVAPLFGADELKVFEVLRDEETIAGMRARAGEFWMNHVVPQIPPEPKELADVNAIFRRENDQLPALIADEYLAGLYYELRAAKLEIKALDARCDSLEFKLKAAMKDCGEMIVEGEKAISWKVRPTSHLDQTGLKEAYPKIHREFVRKGEARVFTPKL